MTLVFTTTWDGRWDGGRMPCRGAFPFAPTTVGPNLDVLREKATAAGWRLTVDGDYCPAHASEPIR